VARIKFWVHVVLKKRKYLDQCGAVDLYCAFLKLTFFNVFTTRIVCTGMKGVLNGEFEGKILTR
jgi:hypothetical protein